MSPNLVRPALALSSGVSRDVPDVIVVPISPPRRQKSWMRDGQRRSTHAPSGGASLSDLYVGRLTVGGSP